MVGSWGLEPQTSTVSILISQTHSHAALSSKLHRRIRYKQGLNPRGCARNCTAPHIRFRAKQPKVTTQSAAQFLAIFVDLLQSRIRVHEVPIGNHRAYL